MPKLQITNPIEKIQTTVKSASVDKIITVLNSDSVQKEWLGWLENAFKHSKTHDALLFLLLNGIKDSRFLVHAKDYGLDLISHNVSQPEVKKNSSEMIVDCFVNEPRVVKESLELCKWFV